MRKVFNQKEGLTCVYPWHNLRGTLGHGVLTDQLSRTKVLTYSRFGDFHGVNFHHGQIHHTSMMSLTVEVRPSVHSWPEWAVRAGSLTLLARPRLVCLASWKVHMSVHSWISQWRFLQGSPPRKATPDQAMCEFATRSGASSRAWQFPLGTLLVGDLSGAALGPRLFLTYTCCPPHLLDSNCLLEHPRDASSSAFLKQNSVPLPYQNLASPPGRRHYLSCHPQLEIRERFLILSLPFSSPSES